MELLKAENFKGIIDGKQVMLYTLRNRNGCVAQFTNYGARWLSMWTPDRQGVMADVVLGFDTLDAYREAAEKYYGAIVGRVCGRLDKGMFALNGLTYRLTNNDLFGEPVRNHLHGGDRGFSFRMWDGYTAGNEKGEEMVKLRYCPKDGEEGYPGNMEVTVTCTLTHDNAITIVYEAVTDAPTIVNLTSHPYFNLRGDMSRNVLDHRLYIRADHALECNAALIPTGRSLPVAGTPLDFTRPAAIGARIHEALEGQLFAGKGYVTAYVLNKEAGALPLAARLEEKESGRVLEVYTGQPVLQLYNAAFFDGTDTGKNGQRYGNSSGVALETQDYPDAPNHPAFPSIVLNPGDLYRRETVYRFLTR